MEGANGETYGASLGDSDVGSSLFYPAKLIWILVCGVGWWEVENVGLSLLRFDYFGFHCPK
jgi:hypothetical protein